MAGIDRLQKPGQIYLDWIKTGRQWWHKLSRPEFSSNERVCVCVCWRCEDEKEKVCAPAKWEVVSEEKEGYC